MSGKGLDVTCETETFVGIGWHLDVIEVDGALLSLGPVGSEN